MKFKLARAEGEGWKAYAPGEKVPEGEVKEVDAVELLARPNDWELIEFCEAVLRRHYRYVVTSNDSDLSNVAWNLGEQEYAKELTGDAEDLRDDILSGEIDDSEELYERMHSVCDNTVTYTRHCYEVVQHTDNVEYGFTEGLINYDPKRPENLITSIAYWAYYGDLLERLGKMEGIDLRADKLGRCEDCDGKGYTIDSNDVIRRCEECDKYDTRAEAAEAAVDRKDAKKCLRCDNKSYTLTGVRGAPEACTNCSTLADEEACELAQEDGVEPPEDEEGET